MCVYVCVCCPPVNTPISSDTTDLKEETLLGNLLIFLGESISQRHDIGPVVVEDEITAEKRHCSRGGHRVEAILRRTLWF